MKTKGNRTQENIPGPSCLEKSSVTAGAYGKWKLSTALSEINVASDERPAFEVLNKGCRQNVAGAYAPLSLGCAVISTRLHQAGGCLEPRGDSVHSAVWAPTLPPQEGLSRPPHKEVRPPRPALFHPSRCFVHVFILLCNVAFRQRTILFGFVVYVMGWYIL